MKRIGFFGTVALLFVLLFVGSVGIARAQSGGLLTGHNPTFDSDLSAWHYNASGWTWTNTNDGVHNGAMHFEFENNTGAAIGFRSCSDQIYPYGNGNSIPNWQTKHWRFDLEAKVNNQSSDAQDYTIYLQQYVSLDVAAGPTETMGTPDEMDSNWHARSKTRPVMSATTGGAAVCVGAKVLPGDKVVINFDNMGMFLEDN